MENTFYIPTDILLILAGDLPQKETALSFMREHLGHQGRFVTSLHAIEETYRFFLERKRAIELSEFIRLVEPLFEEIHSHDPEDLSIALSLSDTYRLPHGHSLHVRIALRENLHDFLSFEKVYSYVPPIRVVVPGSL